MAVRTFLAPLDCTRPNSDQQLRRFDFQRLGETINHINAGIVDPSFQRADVGAVNIRAVRKFLLRKAFGQAGRSQIPSEYLTYLHGQEINNVKSISPRSIFYKDFL